MKQIEKISTAFSKNGLAQLRKEKIWLGGFFTPEAYLTAIRQCVAQSNNWSLEELVLSVEFNDSINTETSTDGFGITGSLDDHLKLN